MGVAITTFVVESFEVLHPCELIMRTVGLTESDAAMAKSERSFPSIDVAAPIVYMQKRDLSRFGVSHSPFLQR